MTTTKTKGLSFRQVFSKANAHPFDAIEWVQSHAKITEDGTNKVIFEQEVEAPSTWSPLAVKIAASKYFYGDIALGTDPCNGGRETSVKQLVTRVAKTISNWGADDQIFESTVEAAIFEKELTSLLVNPYAAFNSPVWFNVGLYQEYGVGKGTSAGNYYYNRAAKKVMQAPNQYERPQASACLPYRGRINTTRGLIPIGEVVRRFNKGETFDVFDADGKSSPVVAAICNGKRRTSTVHFRGGASLDLTSDHVVFVSNAAGVVECHVKDLVPGDKCILSRSILIPDKCPVVLNGETMTEDDAWIGGLMVGNGFSGRSPTSTSDTWELKVNTTAQRDRIITVTAAAGLSCGVQDFHWGFVIRGYGEAGRAYWERMGLWNHTGNKVLPEWVFRTSVKVLTQFLQGLFDTDGYINRRSGDRCAIHFGNTSEQVAQSVSWLLTSLGIFNQLSSYTDPREDSERKPCWYVSVSDMQSAERFAEVIGFTHEEKAKTLDETRSYMEGWDYRTSVLVVEKVDKGKVTELVYDIQTGCGSFWYQGILVHNCFIQRIDDNMAVKRTKPDRLSEPHIPKEAF